MNIEDEEQAEVAVQEEEDKEEWEEDAKLL